MKLSTDSCYRKRRDCRKRQVGMQCNRIKRLPKPGLITLLHSHISNLFNENRIVKLSSYFFSHQVFLRHLHGSGLAKDGQTRKCKVAQAQSQFRKPSGVWPLIRQSNKMMRENHVPSTVIYLKSYKSVILSLEGPCSTYSIT